MKDDPTTPPLMDDPNVAPAVRRLLRDATAPLGIPEASLRAGRRALTPRAPTRSGWRLSHVAAFATLLVVGVTLAASKSGWRWQASQPFEVLEAQESRNGPVPLEVRGAGVDPATTSAAPPVASSMPKSPAHGLGEHGGAGATAAAPQFSSAPGRAIPQSSLEGEVAALREARAELATNPGRALAQSRAHLTRFPAAHLRLEASLLEVEALVRLGRRDEARRMGRQLLGAPGASLYRERVESLLRAASIP